MQCKNRGGGKSSPESVMSKSGVIIEFQKSEPAVLLFSAADAQRQPGISLLRWMRGGEGTRRIAGRQRFRAAPVLQIRPPPRGSDQADGHAVLVGQLPAEQPAQSRVRLRRSVCDLPSLHASIFDHRLSSRELAGQLCVRPAYEAVVPVHGIDVPVRKRHVAR